MMTLEQIQARHEALAKAAEQNPKSVRIGQATNLATQASEAGAQVGDENGRQALQGIISHWANFVAEQTGEPLTLTLAEHRPPVADADPAAQSEVVSPPTTKAIMSSPNLRGNRAAPPEWMVRGFMVVVILGLAVASFLILRNFFNREAASGVANEATPTLEATTAAILEAVPPTAVLAETPTAVVVEVVVAETAVVDPNAPTSAPQRTHIVSANDSLFTIAGRYGVTVEEIIASNSLANPNRLEIGQELVIPFAGEVAVATAVATTSAADLLPTATPRPVITPEVVIRAGEQTAVVPLFLAPNADSAVVATLSQGTFGIALGLSEDRGWYLIELNNGQTRGWVTVQDAELLSPATQDDLLLLRVVETP